MKSLLIFSNCITNVNIGMDNKKAEIISYACLPLVRNYKEERILELINEQMNFLSVTQLTAKDIIDNNLKPKMEFNNFIYGIIDNKIDFVKSGSELVKNVINGAICTNIHGSNEYTNLSNGKFSNGAYKPDKSYANMLAKIAKQTSPYLPSLNKLSINEEVEIVAKCYPNNYKEKKEKYRSLGNFRNMLITSLIGVSKKHDEQAVKKLIDDMTGFTRTIIEESFDQDRFTPDQIEKNRIELRLKYQNMTVQEKIEKRNDAKNYLTTEFYRNFNELKLKFGDAPIKVSLNNKNEFFKVFIEGVFVRSKPSLFETYRKDAYLTNKLSKALSYFNDVMVQKVVSKLTDDDITKLVTHKVNELNIEYDKLGIANNNSFKNKK
jgi:hypothetical protein